jgi:hypothetical protein
MSKSKSVILLPPVLIWSLFYGVVGGVFFKLLSVYELWMTSNRHQIMQWKRYPARDYRQFTSAVLMGRMGDNTWSALPIIRNQITHEFTQAPFPYLVILCNTLLALLYLPFALVTGILRGPGYVFAQLWTSRQDTLTTGNGR